MKIVMHIHFRSSIFSLPFSVKSGESVSTTFQAVKLLRKLYNVDVEKRQNLVLMVSKYQSYSKILINLFTDQNGKTDSNFALLFSCCLFRIIVFLYLNDSEQEKPLKKDKHCK